MTAADLLILVPGALLILLGGVMVVGNVAGALDALLRRGSTSFVPVVGGVLLALGVLLMPLLPWPWRWRLALAALVVDISIPALLLVFICWAIPPLRRRTLDRRPEEGAQTDEREE